MALRRTWRGCVRRSDNVGNSMRDLVIPVFDELAKRFEAPPDDSYIVAIDTLENSFTLFQASIGDLFLANCDQRSDRVISIL